MKTIAKALIFDQSERLLVLRRSATHPRYACHLDFPGGEVETNEQSLEAVIREVAEEAGFTFDKSLANLAYGKQVAAGIMHEIFIVRIQGKQPIVKLSWEHDQYEWLTRQELLTRPLPVGADDYFMTVHTFLNNNPR